jgi:anthranilate synthase component 1
MFNITQSQLEELAKQGTHVSLSVQIPTDTETPISLYYKLAHGQANSFLLESAEQDARMGRYSFIGFDPVQVLKFEVGGAENPLDVIKAEMEKIKMVEFEKSARLDAGFVGYFSYEMIRHFEKIPVPEQESASGIPEGVFILPRVLVVFDHVKRMVNLHYLVDLSGDLNKKIEQANQAAEQVMNKLQEPIGVPFLRPHRSLNPKEHVEIIPSKNEFMEQVEQARESIKSGDIFQIVLSHSMEMATEKSAFELYRQLRRENPSPYMYILQYEDFAVVGASPETMVRLEGEDVLVRPIAGTRHRGTTPEEDKQLEADLHADPKERAEHMMLVDLGRNDVGRVCKVGSVEVTNQMYTQRFSSVMHLVSDVIGKIRPDMDMFDVLKAAFPAGTLSGAPKIRACELIASLEKRQRGIYGGGVGYFDFSGNMDFAIAIRTMIHREGRVYLQAGAGVVYDSIPENEHNECFHKATSCLSVL